MFNQRETIQTPCNGCKERSFNCWGSCSKYLEFKETNQQIKAAKKEYKNSISNIARSGVQRAKV